MKSKSGSTTEVALLNLTDEQLLAQALGGDEDAFTALYRKRQGAIFRFALHMSGSSQVAEEVTQDVFVFLLQRGRDLTQIEARWVHTSSGWRAITCGAHWSAAIRRRC